MGVHSGVFKSQTLISSLLPGIRPVFATGITGGAFFAATTQPVLLSVVLFRRDPERIGV
jgi:hypothetical protein